MHVENVKILVSHDPTDLARKIKAKMEDGWHIKGYSTSQGQSRYAQPLFSAVMVLYKPLPSELHLFQAIEEAPSTAN